MAQVTIRELMLSGMRPSQAFRHLFDCGAVQSNHDLVHLAYTEFDDLSESVMPAVMAWNRGTKPERAGIGLSDERLDEIISQFMLVAVHSGANGA
jgi:hypothetical protein